MEKNQAAALYIFSCVCLGLSACARTLVIETSQPADVVQLVPALDGAQQNIGAAPVRIEEVAPFYVFGFKRTGFSDEYLILPIAQELAGKVMVPLEANASSSRRALRGRYLDQLAFAHRLLLRGQLEDAKFAIRELDENYGATYGSVIIAANVAVIEGRSEDAQTLFRIGEDLFK